MAGGLFPGQPFSFNIKCIVFTAVVAGGYWFLPPRSWWVLAVLLWLPYVAMAWYDYAYECRNHMQPTLFPFGRYVFLPFKPPSYQQEYSALPRENIEAMERLDHVTAWTLLVASAACVLYARR